MNKNNTNNTNNINNTIKEQLEIAKTKIRYIISSEYYSELDETGKELFQESKYGSKYYAELPALIEDNDYLSDYIRAGVEVLIVICNPKYEITENTTLETEILRLSKDDKTFNLLVNIKHKDNNETFHDILIFKEKSNNEDCIEYEMIGDQRMFAMK